MFPMCSLIFRIEINSLVKIFIRKVMILLLGALTSKLAFFAMVMMYVWLGNPISAELVYFILTLLQRVRHAFNVVIPMGITESAELYASAKRIEALLKTESVTKNADEKTVLKDNMLGFFSIATSYCGSGSLASSGVNKDRKIHKKYWFAF
ncbi:unnamed protein product [Acanthoscelides obtectus]|uniref:ABC transmembrane type-1 domain-containing protein n=1 Tax=Acanthoscelides obtectus TaxID=200917 RepID=A0A9P0Q5P7_ACAOB|nr:unnamed protein product [Acanthoscelides obtectus]CAH2012967.1 unnamed protein product [Acanthoscelides obtectus]CAK1642109.1 hypothetical protein AOBTE_LOCUS12837 [Acanthoscelides obtectus]CAK1642126.1 hypothetical protein AOBTE_LOCUS12844 [Acanthoscelides obtectus]